MDSIGSIDTAVATMTNFIYFGSYRFSALIRTHLKLLICQQQTRTFPVKSTDNSEIYWQFLIDPTEPNYFICTYTGLSSCL